MLILRPGMSSGRPQRVSMADLETEISHHNQYNTTRMSSEISSLYGAMRMSRLDNFMARLSLGNHPNRLGVMLRSWWMEFTQIRRFVHSSDQSLLHWWRNATPCSRKCLLNELVLDNLTHVREKKCNQKWYSYNVACMKMIRARSGPGQGERVLKINSYRKIIVDRISCQCWLNLWWCWCRCGAAG